MSANVEKYHHPRPIRTDYTTPDSIFEPLHREFDFTLDVCASLHNTKCRRFFSVEENGLNQSWSDERCWMNPPYGRAIKEWVRKAHDTNMAKKGLVVALLPARTDTDWWWRYVIGVGWPTGAHEIRFVRGRIKFAGMKSNAPFPSAIVIWRPS